MNHIFSKKLTFFIFLFIFMVGSYIRLGGVFTNSFAFTYDVGRDMLAVEKILTEKKPVLIGPTTGLEGVFYGPTWYYVLTVPFLLSGGNPQGLALFMAGVGILCIFFAFLVGKRIDGEFLGLVFASFIAISRSMIGISGQIWSPNLVPLFLFPSLIITIIFFSKKFLSRMQALILGLSLGFLMDMGFVFGVLYLVAFSIALGIFSFRYKILKKEFLFVIVGIFSTFLPRILFELRHQFLMTNSFLRFITGETPAEKSLSLIHALQNRSVIFFDTFSDSVTGGNKLFAVICLLLIIFLSFVLFKKFKKLEKEVLFFSFSIIIVYFIVLTLFPHDIFAHYLIGIPIFFLLVISIGINVLRRQSKLAAVGMIALILFVNIDILSLFSMFSPSWEGNAAVYRNQLATIEYVYQQANNKQFNYIAYTPVVHDYTYQYLFSWYGKTHYGYSPSVEKQQQFFVIMEPDHERPSRLMQWLEVRKEDGKIISEKVVKGGIRVQIRKH